jgi:hypothetical protein
VPLGAAVAAHHETASRAAALRRLSRPWNSALNGEYGLTDLDISVARDKVVFNMGELTGNIWLAKLEGDR